VSSGSEYVQGGAIIECRARRRGVRLVEGSDVAGVLDILLFGLVFVLSTTVLMLGWSAPVLLLPLFCAYVNPITLTTVAVVNVEKKTVDAFIVCLRKTSEGKGVP
jgi:hypothetical protein